MVQSQTVVGYSGRNYKMKKTKLTTIDKTFVSLPLLIMKTVQPVLTTDHHMIWQCQYLRDTDLPTIRVTSVTMIVFNCALIRTPLSLPSAQPSSDSPPPSLHADYVARVSLKRLPAVISLWNVIFRGGLNTKALEVFVFLRNYVAYCVPSGIQ